MLKFVKCEPDWVDRPGAPFLPIPGNRIQEILNSSDGKTVFAAAADAKVETFPPIRRRAANQR